MKSRLRSLVLIVGVLVSVLPAHAQPADQAETIRAVFAGYRTALLARDGESAVNLLSQSTIDYYGEMQQLALYGSRETVQSLSLVNQMQVLLLRLRLEPARLKGMSPRQLMVHAVDQGWIGENSVLKTRIGPVSVEGRVAIANAIVDGQTSALTFRFVNEAKGWHLDLVPTVQASNAALQLAAKQRGVSELDFISLLVESAVGRKVGPSVWQPPFAKP